MSLFSPSDRLPSSRGDVAQQRCRIALLNPNTNSHTTALMLACARGEAPAGVVIEGHTAPRGCSMITNPVELDAAAAVVVELGTELGLIGYAGIIVAGFGDPGLSALRERVKAPVTGLAEASIAEAASGGRRFSIVTVTPELEASLRAAAMRNGGAGVLASIRFTAGPLAQVMATPAGLAGALLESCRLAVSEDRAAAIVIGGGPLARAANEIAGHLGVPVIDPVAAAIRLASARAGGLTR